MTKRLQGKFIYAPTPGRNRVILLLGAWSPQHFDILVFYAVCNASPSPKEIIYPRDDCASKGVQASPPMRIETLVSIFVYDLV